MAAPLGVTPYGDELETFAKFVTDKLINKIAKLPNVETDKVGSFLHPDKLSENIDFELPSGEDPVDYKKLSNAVEFLVDNSTNTNHPLFFNQLFASPDPLSVIGDWVGAACNTTMATYEMSGQFIMMEQAMMKFLRSKVGTGEGWENGDGLLCPGGSACNQMGVTLARFAKFPESKTKGLHAVGRLVLFSSEESHYSLDKAAFAQGFGTDNLVKVPCDASGRMDPVALRNLVQQTVDEGGKPFFVNATAGTTVRGAFDPFTEISAVCKEFGMWLHVDGAWGGPIMCSEKYPELCKGLELCDSLTIDGHKLWGQTQQIAFILVKGDGNLLHKCNSANAKYLFQADKPLAEYDTGDKTIQCGRRNDILKMWLNWQAIGTKGVSNRVDRVLDISRQFAKFVREREGFVCIQDPQCTNVCFYYIPSSLRSDPIAKRLLDGEDPFGLLRSPEAESFCTAIGRVAPYIKAKTLADGTFMCGFQAVCGLPNFWRIVFANPLVNDDNLNSVLDIISTNGENWANADAQTTAPVTPTPK